MPCTRKGRRRQKFPPPQDGGRTCVMCAEGERGSPQYAANRSSGQWRATTLLTRTYPQACLKEAAHRDGTGMTAHLSPSSAWSAQLL